MWKSVLALACILVLSTWPLFESMHCDNLAADNETRCTHISMKLNWEENAGKQLRWEAHFTAFSFISSENKYIRSRDLLRQKKQKRRKEKKWEIERSKTVYLQREVRKEFVCWWGIFFFFFFLLWPLPVVEKN